MGVDERQAHAISARRTEGGENGEVPNLATHAPARGASGQTEVFPGTGPRARLVVLRTTVDRPQSGE